jgi:hypothetical protein
MKYLLRSFFLAAFLLLTYGARAGEPRQTVWLLSTRDAPHCGELQEGPQAICYSKLENCDWTPSDERTFQDSDAGPTVVFISGNQTDAQETVEKGCFLYPMIRCVSEGKSFRYVIWSWPADRVCRRVRSDAQLKVAYSKAESYYLAQWMAHLEKGVNVSLIGHSLGARIIANAANLLSGGKVAGRTLPQNTIDPWKGGKRNAVNAVFLAAAMDAEWFADEEHAKSLAMFHRVLITQNGCDRVLRFYPRLWGRGGPQAIGFVGPCRVDSEKVEVLDVSATVGKRHDYNFYCSDPCVQSQWARYLFFEDSPLQSAP